MAREVLVALMLVCSLQAWGLEFACNEGKKYEIDLPEGMKDYRCMLEKEPNVYVRVGPFILTKNENIILDANFDSNGEPHGKWRTWTDDGKLTSEGHYKHGVKDGVWVTWDGPSGNPRQAVYKQGVIESP